MSEDSAESIKENLDIPLQFARVDGGLIQFYDYGPKGVLVQSIDSEKHGAGTEAVSLLKSRIGAGRNVDIPTIVEAKTLQQLKESGITGSAFASMQTVEIVDPKIISQLRLAKVFQDGGITIDGIVGKPEVNFDNGKPVYKIIYDMKGHT